MGIDEPCRFDLEVFDLEIIEGAVPDEIDGLLVQAVPDQVYLPEVEVLFPMTVAAGGDGAGGHHDHDRPTDDDHDGPRRSPP